MDSRSGRRLPNWLKKANKKVRRKERAQAKANRRRLSKIFSREVNSEYRQIDRAITNYIKHYLNSYHSRNVIHSSLPGSSRRSVYIRLPFDGRRTVLDVHNISYSGDVCTIQTKFLRLSESEYSSRQRGDRSHKQNWYDTPRFVCADQLYQKETLIKPNFFDELRVYLDKCLALYWEVCEVHDHHLLEDGLLSIIRRELSEALDEHQIIIIDESDSEYDEAAYIDIRYDGLTRAKLNLHDGLIWFDHGGERMVENAASVLPIIRRWNISGQRLHLPQFFTEIVSKLKDDSLRSSNFGSHPQPKS